MRFEQEKRLEGEVFKAVQEVGVSVDKDELIKALKYDQDQYTKGFADGCKSDIDELCKRVRADTVREMHSEIKTRFAMRFGTYTDKDITPITEVFWFLDQIAKEMMEDKK